MNTSQNEMILDHLKTFGSITPLKALEEYGCMRLSARIADLKSMGYNIRTDMISRRNRFGRKIMFAEYTLITKELKEVVL